MLCDTCKNKHICKHFEYFKNISINLTIKLDYCELFSNNQQVATLIHNPDKRPLYRQPLPSNEQEEEVDIIEENEDEEKIFIDITNYEEKPQSSSIIDLVMKGDLADDQEKN